MMGGDLFIPITDELQSAMHTNTHAAIKSATVTPALTMP